MITERTETRFSQLNVVMIGLPGSGKSTLIESLPIKPNYISLGEITRRELANNGPKAEIISEKFKTFDPWPAEFVIDIIAPYILNVKMDGFVLDGIPRKTDEAMALSDWLDKNEIQIDLLLHLEVSAQKALERILYRNEKDRLETFTHYETRIKKYLNEEDELLEIMRRKSRKSLSLNTNSNSAQKINNLLIDFVNKNF